MKKSNNSDKLINAANTQITKIVHKIKKNLGSLDTKDSLSRPIGESLKLLLKEATTLRPKIESAAAGDHKDSDAFQKHSKSLNILDAELKKISI